MQTIRKLLLKYKEILLYLVFGVLTTVVDFLVYKPLTMLAPNSALMATAATAVAWVAAVAFAFVTNKLWVFEDKRWTKDPLISQAVRFLTARVFTLVLSLPITYFGTELLNNWVWYQSISILAKHTSDMIWIIKSVLTVVLNYIFSKLWIFKKDKENKDV